VGWGAEAGVAAARVFSDGARTGCDVVVGLGSTVVHLRTWEDASGGSRCRRPGSRWCERPEVKPLVLWADLRAPDRDAVPAGPPVLLVIAAVAVFLRDVPTAGHDVVPEAAVDGVRGCALTFTVVQVIRRAETIKRAKVA
jgi:hypothetical protein